MNGAVFTVNFITVMTNIDFNVGFIVNRENLDKYMNQQTEHNSLLETSFGYTGVNIKFPSNCTYYHTLIPQITYTGVWNDTTIPSKTYYDQLSTKEKEKNE